MDSVALEHYLSDSSRLGPALPETTLGRAGGAACGDVVEISLHIRDGRINGLRRSATGCAAARAASAAVAELADGAALPEAALIDAAAVSAELGGLSPVGAHAADLAAEALHRALGMAASRSDGELLSPPADGRQRVLVAMSGGVDSAVAALREREGGAEVLAITLELWSDPANDGERSCCSADAVRTARALAHSLGIPHLTVDLRDAFRAGVVEPFLSGYAEGRTPNPCVSCNGNVRIEPMVRIAERLGATALATGHYARLVDDGEGSLLASADPAKDQTYMLAGLTPDLLERIRFPLGQLSKPRVRELAREAGLTVADRAESQDLCFLSGVGKSGFLARHGGLGDRVGEIVDRGGQKLGSHQGHHHFTVGQRRGIGIGAPEPFYVLATDAATNRVTVGAAADLEVSTVRVRDAVLHRPGARVGEVKLRYRSKPLKCAITTGEGLGVGPGRHADLRLELDRPARAAAPGQTAVFCDGDVVVGHGTIA
jgi:tRNA-specific 2-thiouridylase